MESLTIKFDNFNSDAMFCAPNTEVARILRKLAKAADQGIEDLPEFLRDINGNKIGTVSIF